MNVLGPRSVASALHLLVKIALVLAIARALIMLIAPVFPYTALRYLSFDVRSGPLCIEFPVLSLGEAKWWIWGMELVSRTLYAVIVYLLSRILGPLGSGELFAPKTASSLRLMGCAVVVGSALRTFFCAALLRMGMAAGSGAKISWAVDADGLFLGIVLIVLAEVFRRGYAIQAEAELTV